MFNHQVGRNLPCCVLSFWVSVWGSNDGRLLEPRPFGIPLYGGIDVVVPDLLCKTPVTRWHDKSANLGARKRNSAADTEASKMSPSEFVSGQTKY